MMNHLKPLLFGLVLGLLLAGGLTAYAAWSPPSAPPPGANAEAPLNVGMEEQRKTGSLIIEGNISTLANIASVGSVVADMNMEAGGDIRAGGSMLVGELGIGSIPAPALGYGKIYVNSADRKLYYLTSTNQTFDLTATGGGGETLVLLQDFNTPGSYEWLVPTGDIILHVDVRGAEGGKGARMCYRYAANFDPCSSYVEGGVGGKGARVQSRFSGLGGTKLYINVGGMGVTDPLGRGTGGSASDVRQDSNGNLTPELIERRIVAGGGGGGSSAMEFNIPDPDRGALNGLDGGSAGQNGGEGGIFIPGDNGGGGGTQSGGGSGSPGESSGNGENGTLGLGGEGYTSSVAHGGSGGDGYYGGGGGGLYSNSDVWYATGGGGGSSNSTGDSTTYETGANAGDGRILIYQVVSGGGSGGGVADNLGNHIATLDLNMSGKKITNAESIQQNGGVALPACAVANRGQTWLWQGASGVEDGYYICKKKTDGTYGWTALGSPKLTEAITFSGDQSHTYPSGGGWWTIQNFIVPAKAKNWACNYSLAFHGSSQPISSAGTRLACNGSELQSTSMSSSSSGLEGPPANINTGVLAGGTAQSCAIEVLGPNYLNPFTLTIATGGACYYAEAQ